MANYTVPATIDLSTYFGLLRQVQTNGSGPTGVLSNDLSSYLAALSLRQYTQRRTQADSPLILPFGTQPTRPTAGQLYPRPTP